MSDSSSLSATTNPALQQIDALAHTLTMLREQCQHQFQVFGERIQEVRTIAEMQLDARELEQRISTLEAEGAQLAENLKETRASREAAEHQTAELRRSLEAEQQRVKELQQDLMDRSTAAEAARERVTLLEKQSRQLEEKLAAAQNETGAERTKLEAELASLRTALDAAGDASAKVAALEARLEAAQLSLAALEEDKNGLAATVSASQEAAEALRGQLAESEAAKQSAAQDREQQIAAQDALRAEIDALKGELLQRVPAAELDKLRSELREATAKAQALEAKLQAETSRGNKALIASQLAEALRDAELANDEVMRLRTELAELRPSPNGESGGSQVSRILEVISRQAGNQKRTLGDLLIESGIVTQEQVNECLDVQKRNPHQHIGSILVERQLASQEAIAHGLAYQSGVKFTKLNGREISETAIGLLNERLAAKHLCVPIDADDEHLVLAMANPVDVVAIEDIERETARSVEVVVSTEAEIKSAIAKYY